MTINSFNKMAVLISLRSTLQVAQQRLFVSAAPGRASTMNKTVNIEYFKMLSSALSCELFKNVWLQQRKKKLYLSFKKACFSFFFYVNNYKKKKKENLEIACTCHKVIVRQGQQKAYFIDYTLP